MEHKKRTRPTLSTGSWQHHSPGCLMLGGKQGQSSESAVRGETGRRGPSPGPWHQGTEDRGRHWGIPAKGEGNAGPGVPREGSAPPLTEYSQLEAGAAAASGKRSCHASPHFVGRSTAVVPDQGCGQCATGHS